MESAALNKEEPVALNILAPENLRNPYPMFQYLLSEAPLFFDENSKFYVVSRHEDIERLMKDPRVSADRYTTLAADTPAEDRDMNDAIVRYLSMFLLNLEGERHTRLRNLTNRSFLPKHMESLGPFAQEVTDELLDAVAKKGELEIISDLAFPMPIRFICRILGLPNADVQLIKTLSDYVSVYVGSAGKAPGCIPLTHRGFTELADLFYPVVQERRKHPTDDLVSSLINVRIGDDALSDEEVVANCILFLVSGFETTTNLIAAGTLALLEHPDQLGLLKNDPTLIDGAIEEMLRFYPPVNRTARVLTDDVEIHGVTLKKGQIIILMLGAGNRDPRVFANPDSFDIWRPRTGKILSFGAGHHFCVGSHLARLEAKIAIQSLLHRFPALKLKSDSISWRGESRFRGLQSMTISL
ncbi:cytochrome P450 [Burkholderia cepacia]|uniref:cytochrome P450 n=1 Tax=Burkholderia cepacia TaxID=292 RepID=UPI00075740C3|nr:cytochrome P450 [Burkholderia cepacia]KVW75500.1 cytochrome [Burkholderia cepacia]KVX62315.1 cytochrome [Burkholderia cepacia]